MYKSVNFHGNVDLSKYNFLVTGGAGFIGSHIADYLCTHGAKSVRVMDNYSTGLPTNIALLSKHSNFEFYEKDIRKLQDCQLACEGIDFISHQAALGSVPRSIKNPIDSNENNVTGFLNMITSARDANVKRFVYASSSSVYGDSTELPKIEANIGRPLSPYAITKYTNELYAHVYQTQYAIETIGFRYFNVFGPRQNPNGAYAAVIPLFIDNLLKGVSPTIDGDGLQTRDFTYIQNVVEINVKAMFATHAQATHQIYNVAVGKNYSVLDLFNNLQSLIGTNLQPDFRMARKGDIRNSLADITKAKTLLSYNPEVSFEEGLKLTLEYFKK
jgi:UDP-N-acetylglucosamine 4-epimerase